MPSLDTMMSYHRLKRAPLDDSQIFNNLVDLMNYCDSGACYNGQRVSVCDENVVVEYTIKEYNERYFPIIDTKCSDLIFKYDEYNNEYWLLIYEYNSISGTEWRKNEVFSFDEEKLCIISQLEIFRLFDGNQKYFEFMLTRQKRDGTENSDDTWTQNANPYSDSIGNTKGIEYIEESSYNVSIKYNSILNMNYNDTNKPMMLMSYDGWRISDRNENNFITKIYIKATDYYNALNNIVMEVS